VAGFISQIQQRDRDWTRFPFPVAQAPWHRLLHLSAFRLRIRAFIPPPREPLKLSAVPFADRHPRPWAFPSAPKQSRPSGPGHTPTDRCGSSSSPPTHCDLLPVPKSAEVDAGHDLTRLIAPPRQQRAAKNNSPGPVLESVFLWASPACITSRTSKSRPLIRAVLGL
jgi:hypothetical protein